MDRSSTPPWRRSLASNAPRRTVAQIILALADGKRKLPEAGPRGVNCRWLQGQDLAYTEPESSGVGMGKSVMRRPNRRALSLLFIVRTFAQDKTHCGDRRDWVAVLAVLIEPVSNSIP